MIFVNGASVDAVHAEEFELVLAVKSNEVIMDQTFLRKLVVVRYSV